MPDRQNRSWLRVGLALAMAGLVAAACVTGAGTPAQASGPTPEPTPWEHLPPFASVRLTAEPASPNTDVRIEVSDPGDPDFRRAHTFAAGRPPRGSIPVSAGRYRLAGPGGACALDPDLQPEHETDVILHLPDGQPCFFTVAAVHGSEIDHGLPDELVATWEPTEP